MKPGRVTGRVVCTSKDPSLEGKKILLLKPMSWRQLDGVLNSRKEEPEDTGKSVLALDAVGAGAAEYVFYVSSKEACQAFEDEPVCHNAVIGIVDGMRLG